MSQTSFLHSASVSKMIFQRVLLFGCALLALLNFSPPAHAQEDAYLRVYDLIEQGDSLLSGGKTNAAISKYQQAEAGLRAFQHDYPNSNKGAVAFRLNYVSQQITSLTRQPGTETPVNTPLVRSSGPEARPAATNSVVQVKLLTPGAEPRNILRLHPNVGDKQSVAMTMKMAMTTKMGDASMPQIKLPAMNMMLDLMVTNVSPDGDITYEMVISDATVSDDPEAMQAAVAAMKTSLGSLKGLSSTAVITSRGVSKSIEFKIPSGLDPQVSQTMDQMKESFSRLATPLPEDAVGTGAKWEVRLPMKSRGIFIDQTATYQIVSIEGDRITCDVTLAQRASNQKIQSAAAPGMNLDLVSMTGSAMGSTTFDLSQVLPPHATMNDHTDMAMGMMVAGKKQTMAMQMDINVQLQAK